MSVVYESLLARLGRDASWSGEFYTPRPIVRFMVRMVEPKLKERVYDPAVGHVLGGGGRYDELIGRFGRQLPAAGFALHLERVHIAQAEEERIG